SQARVDSSVRQILDLKHRFALDRQRFVDLDSVRVVVGDTTHLALAQTAAQRSITLAKDSLHVVPLAGTGSPSSPRVFSVTIASRTDLPAGTTFNAEVRRELVSLRTELVYPDDPSLAASIPRLLAAADSADVTIVSSYLATSSTTSTPNAPEPV